MLPALQPSALQAQSCSAKNILFVGSTNPLAARDEPLRVYLFALGHTVTVRSAAAVKATDAAGKDLIIISESSESVEINIKLRDVTVPIVTWEGWLQDDFGMTGPAENVDYGENLRQQTIRIVNPSHPLAAGLSGITTTVTNNQNKFQWGVPNANATVVAVDVDNATHAMIYVYEQGVQMKSMVAPARRIFIHNATAPNLTIGGWQLFEAAVNYAVGCAGPPPPATLTPTPTATTTALIPNTPTPTPTATATATTAVPGTTATPTTTPTATQLATPIATATTAPTALTNLTIQKQDLLFVDADEDGFASSGDTLLYVVDITNLSGAPVTGITFEDTLGVDGALIVGTVRSDRGTVVIGNRPNDSYVIVNLGDLAHNQAGRILFQVQIRTDTNQTRLQNQAQVRYTLNGPTGQGQQFSDDPDTPERNDATITPLGNPAFNQARLYLPLIAK